jgi:hypothetical protein
VFPVAHFDLATKTPVLTGSYRAFISRRKHEIVGPPGGGRPKKKESYDQHWTLVPVMDTKFRPKEYRTPTEAFNDAIALADWFRGKV